MVPGSAIATLVVFVLSIIFVIYPITVPVRLPYLGKRRIPINLTTAPIVAIAILWAAQCLGPSVIRDGIVGTDGVQPYNILILFFSLAYMAITLDITGVLRAAAFWVSNKGGSNGWKLYFYFYILLTVLSVVLGNDPVILSGTVFLVYYTTATKLKPTAWLMSEFAAANTASMVLFVGNPTNVVICEGFSVKYAAFTAYTILPFLACSVACFLALALQFRGSDYIPRRLNITKKLNARAALLDPVGAWVGSLILGTCLVVIIVVSFFHIDVWKISLPFAGGKFIFDMGWDHYRYARGVAVNVLQRDPDDEAADVDVTPKQSEGSMTPRLPSREETLTNWDAPHEIKTDVPPPSRGVAFEGPPPPTPLTTTIHSPNTRTSTADTAFTITPTDDKGKTRARLASLSTHFPVISTALPRLPFALVPFAFSQFILIEALAHQGWITIFARWLVLASHRQMHPTIWLIGVLGVVLCNISGTNIGATILLTKVVRAAALPDNSTRAAAIALAVASNVGAVSFTFSASLAGLLWRTILEQKGIHIKQREFAMWNLGPLAVMTTVGLAVVSAEMTVLYP